MYLIQCIYCQEANNIALQAFVDYYNYFFFFFFTLEIRKEITIMYIICETILRDRSLLQVYMSIYVNKKIGFT